MARQIEEKEGAARFWLLAIFVVVVTGGVIYWLGSGDANASGPAEESTVQPDEVGDVVEIDPLVPRGKIAEASWREGPAAAPAAEEEAAEDGSLLSGLESDPFGEKKAERRRMQEGIERVVEHIEGLGIYVAPAGEDDGEEGKDKEE